MTRLASLKRLEPSRKRNTGCRRKRAFGWLLAAGLGGLSLLEPPSAAASPGTRSTTQAEQITLRISPVPAPPIEPNSVRGLSRLERYDYSERRDAKLVHGNFRRSTTSEASSPHDYRLAVSDQPLPKCLDLSDSWEVSKEATRSGRTLIVLRIRRTEDAESSGDWYITGRVFEPQIEAFESFPRAAFAIESDGELIADGRIRGRLKTDGRIQVSGPVWFMSLRVDLTLDEASCDRS